MFSMFIETPSFLRRRQQLLDGFFRALIADVIRDRLVIVAPRNVHGARHDEEILNSEVMRRLRHFAGQLDAF